MEHWHSKKSPCDVLMYDLLCTFLLSSIYIEENIGFVKIFDIRFLIDLYILGCPEHDMTISAKVCLSVFLRVSEKHFVASVAQELMNRIS